MVKKTNGPDVDSGQDEAEVSDFYFLVFICVVRTAAPQQEGPELLLLSVFVWVLSGFLPESRDMQLVGLG